MVLCAISLLHKAAQKWRQGITRLSLIGSSSHVSLTHLDSALLPAHSAAEGFLTQSGANTNHQLELSRADGKLSHHPEDSCLYLSFF